MATVLGQRIHYHIKKIFNLNKFNSSLSVTMTWDISGSRMVHLLLSESTQCSVSARSWISDVNFYSPVHAMRKTQTLPPPLLRNGCVSLRYHLRPLQLSWLRTSLVCKRLEATHLPSLGSIHYNIGGSRMTRQCLMIDLVLADRHDRCYYHRHHLDKRQCSSLLVQIFFAL